MEYKKPKQNTATSVTLSKDQKAKIDEALKEAMEKKRSEYGNGS